MLKKLPNFIATRNLRSSDLISKFNFRLLALLAHASILSKFGLTELLGELWKTLLKFKNDMNIDLDEIIPSIAKTPNLKKISSNP